MSNRKQIEKKWIENFKKSPLVDTETGKYNNKYGHQLFYGRKEDDYPVDFPHDFQALNNTYASLSRDNAIDELLDFLHFIGIKIKANAINNHLDKYPNDLQKLFLKSYYILKSLAHYNNELNIENPYYDNTGDVFFLLRIESGESIEGGTTSLI